MKFQQLISGNLSKREFSFILIPILALLVICWTIARSLYPGYAITKNMISDQGNIYNNPIGCWFFIVSTSIAGIMLIFYFIYIYRQFQPTLKILSGFMAIVGCIGGIGLFLVGINPQGLGGINWSIHNIGSDMAFIGLGTACGISFIIMGQRIYQKQMWPSIPQYFGLLILTIQIGLIQFYTGGVSSISQWSGFFTIFVWIIGLFLIIPEK